ncbi:MAG: phenylphosphate carboxylase subunit gamma [Moorellales bacterium]
MASYDTFVNDLSELAEQKEVTLLVRDLTPGRHKYCYKLARALVSSNPNQYPDTLQVRYPKGQLASQQYSLQVLEFVPVLPEKYRS